MSSNTSMVCTINYFCLNLQHIAIYLDVLQTRVKAITLLCAGGRMANEILRQLFQDAQLKIVTSVNPDSVMDALFGKKLISSDDYYRLRETPRVDRCRDLLALLHRSSHPQTFIHLRLALLDEYSWLVDEIDKQLPSLASHLQQLHLDKATDGKLLL